MLGFNKNEIDVDILKALADETRLDILKLLGNKEMNVNEIAQNSRVSRPTISHHLQIMRRARIVEARKEGKETFYSVNNYVLTSLAQSILGFISY
ncbi:winged helix-turn-helix transcriptional regulator [Clostridium sp. D2Q-11]|uniref:Winged helix-turn-helix transcriptional regulator n=1 Tax=Anaeromonas frigoriresistens TaxID=2683708 RepID=A0A942Z6Z6_9FIRM|nr:metalloregulator ArsR/SmtB family transcription factor [Anaeromonas frigoriresistens]MBS4538132.1 winged helix-turn-helix transcriptional regulator [Anaeromonas frigoriresistens]